MPTWFNIGLAVASLLGGALALEVRRRMNHRVVSSWTVALMLLLVSISGVLLVVALDPAGVARLLILLAITAGMLTAGVLGLRSMLEREHLE